MAPFIYQRFKELLAKADIDLDTADIRVALVGSATTADTEKNANLFSDFTTLDEYSASGYTAGGHDLANQQVVRSDGSNIVYFDADDLVFTSLGSSTNGADAILLHVHNATLANRVPLGYQDSGGFPFNGSGTNVTIQWHAEGIFRFPTS